MIRLAVIRRRKAQTEPVTIPEDFGVDWERWADGRAWKLKRKRHFADVDPALVGKAAETAAKKMRKGVMTAKDKMVPEKYLWVQFADHKVGPGQPCPCGSRRLNRVHTNFAKCPQCKALVLLTDVVEEDDEEGEKTKETRAVRTLRELSDVHLELRGRTDDGRREIYRGYGTHKGTPVLLLVEFAVKPREETWDEEERYERVTTVSTVSFSGFSDLPALATLDPATLWNGQEPKWDLVWTESAEQPEESPTESRAAGTLRELSDVHLELHRTTTSEVRREIYRGYGTHNGTPVLLFVEFEVKPKEETWNEEERFGRVTSVRTLSFSDFADLPALAALDPATLWNGREMDWDFVW